MRAGSMRRMHSSARCEWCSHAAAHQQLPATQALDMAFVHCMDEAHVCVVEWCVWKGVCPRVASPTPLRVSVVGGGVRFHVPADVQPLNEVWLQRMFRVHLGHVAHALMTDVTPAVRGSGALQSLGSLPTWCRHWGAGVDHTHGCQWLRWWSTHA